MFRLLALSLLLWASVSPALTRSEKLGTYELVGRYRLSKDHAPVLVLHEGTMSEIEFKILGKLKIPQGGNRWLRVRGKVTKPFGPKVGEIEAREILPAVPQFLKNNGYVLKFIPPPKKGLEPIPGWE